MNTATRDFLSNRATILDAVSVLFALALPALFVTLELSHSPAPLAYFYSVAFSGGLFAAIWGIGALASILTTCLIASVFACIMSYNLLTEWNFYRLSDRLRG